VRYLKATRTQGYIINPSAEKRLDCYVDADFAGMWNPEDSDDPSSVKSRTGYVITFANCPVLWVSKLQTEIALSTTEAEYIALSQALLKELGKICALDFGDIIAHSTIFEDNKGCVELVAIKYHHFREHVHKGLIKVEWIDTKNQLADIFTKPLAGELFKDLRKKLLGW